MPQIKLPKIGLGTMLGMSKKARQAFVKGIDYGYRFLDTAQIYFNERTVGKAIAEANVPRDELIIATKIWISNHKPRRVKKSTERSLKKLQMTFFFRFPFPQPIRTSLSVDSSR